MLRYFCISIFLCIVLTGCSNFQKIMQYTDIYQNEIDLFNINFKKIKLGMKKEEVIYVLGTPTIINIFNKNIWYYINLHKEKYFSKKQKIVKLIFNDDNFLQYINNNI